MKTKQKLVLSLAALSAVTLGIGVTSTFAWFTTTRIATASFTKTTVQALNGNLEIKFLDNGTNGGATTSAAADGVFHTGTAYAVADSTGAKITDISGNGKNFYRPNWMVNSAGASADTINSVANNETGGSEKQYYVEFNVVLHNAGKTPVSVYLTEGTAVTATSSSTNADVAAAKASRVAILVGDTVKSVFTGDTDDAGQYLKTATDGTSAYAVNEFILGTLADADMWHKAAFAAINSKPASDPVGTKVGDLTADNGATGGTDEVTVLIRTWIEGTSKYAVSVDDEAAATNGIYSIIGGNTDLKVNFSAVE